MAKWTVSIDNFLGGYAPRYYAESYPSYGNENNAGAMQNIDLTNPGYMTQGPGLANLTNGTQAGAVTTLIKSILDESVATDVTYGIGGALLHKITPTTVVDDATWPKTIDKAAVTGEDGEDVAHYQGNLYYTYNHSGTAGDIGKFDLNATFDDDWGSTVPTGMAALQYAPHPMTVGGNDVLYIGNGRYVASYNGTLFQPQNLDLPTGTVIVGLKWAGERLYISANNPNLTGSNKNRASIYIWDGTTDSWETEIKFKGSIGGIYVKDGAVFVFYQDISSTGGYKVGYLQGGIIVNLANYSGGLPAFYQITDYNDFLIWNSAGLIYALGSGDKNLPMRLFQLADGGYSTVGALSCTFGTPMVASTESTNYKVAKFSGYDTACNWKSLLFDVRGEGSEGRIDGMIVNFEALTTGARVNWSLKDNQGRTITSDNISYAKAIAGGHTLTSAFIPLNGKQTENFRLEFDFANGSASAPVRIRNAKLYGSAS